MTAVGQLFKTEDVTTKLSPRAQKLIGNIIPMAVREYLEEQPCEADLKSRCIRFLKKKFISTVWIYIRRNPFSYAKTLLAIRYSIPGINKLIYLSEKWKWEIYKHCASCYVGVGMAGKESELPQVYKTLSNIIEHRMGPDVVRGSIAGAVQLELVSPPGEEKRFAVWIGVHTDRGYSELANSALSSHEGRKKLKHLSLIREGEMPPHVSEVK